jgi:hypothetical protein
LSHRDAIVESVYEVPKPWKNGIVYSAPMISIPMITLAKLAILQLPLYATVMLIIVILGSVNLVRDRNGC